jgi:hypothetical protein
VKPGLKSLAPLAAAALVFGAFGSSAKPTGTLTVRSVLSATNAASTYRFSTRSRLGGTALPPYTGEADEHGRASIVQRYGSHPGELDVVFSNHIAYERTVAPDPSQSQRWCIAKTTKATDYPDVGPVGALAGLHADGKSLRRVGAATVRDTPTVHYSIVGAKPSVDIWVDEHDRLRRLVWTHNKGKQTDTVELYDFGAPVTITVPVYARPCPLVPPGFIKPGDCVLGRSFATVPKCPGSGSVTR